jgi:hypothetical protein
LASPALRIDAQGDVLQPRDSLDDRTVASQPEAIGGHETGDDRLPQPPGGLDHQLVRSVQGISAEEHAGGVRVDELLNDDCHLGCEAAGGARSTRTLKASAPS